MNTRLAAALIGGNDAFFPVMPENPTQAVPGAFYAANAADYDTNALSQPLTTYAAGVEDDQDLAALLDAIAPVVPVGGEAFEYLEHNNRKAFMDDFADDGDIIGEGGDVPKVKSSGTKAHSAVDNKGLSMVLLNSRGGQNPVLQQQAVANLKARLMRTEVRRALALLDGIADERATNWKTDGADPDVDVVLDLDAGGDARGVDSNVVLYGGGAWLKRFRSFRQPVVGGNSDRFTSSNMTPEQLKGLFGVDQVVKSKARRQSAKDAKAKIADNVVYTFFRSSSPTPSDPSNLKRFVWHSEAGDMPVYVEEKLLCTIVTVLHRSRIIATSNLGVKRLDVTYA